MEKGTTQEGRKRNTVLFCLKKQSEKKKKDTKWAQLICLGASRASHKGGDDGQEFYV